jgi:hypothetical protein
VSVYLQDGKVLLVGGKVATDAACCCPPITGACCHGAVCTIETAASCTGSGGTYQGDGTTCSPNPCGAPPSGACCHLDGSCTIETAAGCDGTYQGDGTTCDGCTCCGGYSAFDGSGGKYRRYDISVSGTWTRTENNTCGPLLDVLTGNIATAYSAHIDPITCLVVVDSDTRSSDYVETLNGLVITSCSHPEMDCFCNPHTPPLCGTLGIFGQDCGTTGDSDNTTTTATTRTRVYTFNQHVSNPCVGGTITCDTTGSYTATETLSNPC